MIPKQQDAASPGGLHVPFWRRLGRRLGVDVHPGEGPIACLLFSSFFFLITFQYATKSVRQSSFIDNLGAENLPWVYLAVALASYPLLRLYSRFADRVPRQRLAVSTSLLIAASMLVFWWLFRFSWRWMPAFLYVWISIAYVMNVSQFWSFSNQLLDARQAKRLFGFVGAGGLLGGVAGGQVASMVSRLFDTRTTFLVAAVILMLAAAAIYFVHHRHAGPADESPRRGGLDKLDQAEGGLALIRGSRHLRLISLVMMLTVVVAQIVDLQFNWAVEQATGSLDERTAFFGNFYSIMNVSAFLFQLVFTARIHRSLGVGAAMRILPLTMGLGTLGFFVAAVWLPAALWLAAMLLKIGEGGLRYSLDQATRELLFLPVPARVRIKAKAYIDVFVQRGAKGLAALLLLPVTFGLMTAVETGWMSLALIAVWLTVAGSAYREYVTSFRRGLERRQVDAEIPINVDDIATLEVLMQSLGSLDRRQVLHSLEILSRHGRSRLVPPLLLYHDDADVRRRTLELLAEEERLDAAPLVERRLADPSADVRAEAIRVLARLQGREVSELMLPRLSEPDPGVRAAAIACLSSHGDPEHAARARQALDDLLSDGSPAVRREAARAIGAIDGPLYQEKLVQLLYDRRPEVVREAVAAVRRRLGRDGFNALYTPRLVALLSDRRVKHEARTALVACGEQVIPALAYFMMDPAEPAWVRRALPKTISRIGGRQALAALLEALDQGADAFLRRKTIEAISALPEADRKRIDRGRLEREARREARAYTRYLDALGACGLEQRARMAGPVVSWRESAADPELLERLLAERLEDHLHGLFGVLSFTYPARHVWAAHRTLTAGDPALRVNALEYLDNTLDGELRTIVFSVIDERPLADRLERGLAAHGLERRSRPEVLRDALDPASEAEEEIALAMAALYYIYTGRVAELYPEVARLAASPSSRLGETARWISARLRAA